MGMQFDLEAALSRLKSDFIDSSLDKLDEIDNIIDQIYQDCDNRGENFFQLQRDVHSIKGSAGTHGLHLLTLVAHRLEDFLEASPRLTQAEWQSVQVYIDTMRALLARADDPSEDERNTILQHLPHAQETGVTFSKQKQKKVTILIVMQPGVQRKVIGRELAACGFDLSFTDRPVEAIRLALDLNPDAVISDQEFRHMSGVELAHVLKAIELTKDTPFALLDSADFDRSTIPHGTHTIEKSDNFFQNLTDYLVDTGLFGKL